MSTNKEEIKTHEIEFKFKTDIRNIALKDVLIDSYTKHRNLKDLPALVENIKKDLDGQLSRGWTVFAGKQMVGACCFIEDTMVDFEVEGLSFVIFQSFCPTQ